MHSIFELIGGRAIILGWVGEILLGEQCEARVVSPVVDNTDRSAYVNLLPEVAKPG